MKTDLVFADFISKEGFDNLSQRQFRELFGWIQLCGLSLEKGVIPENPYEGTMYMGEDYTMHYFVGGKWILRPMSEYEIDELDNWGKEWRANNGD